MKKINEKELVKVISNFYNSSEKTGAIVLPVNHLNDGLRWYITKETNSFIKFLTDQPILKEIARRTGTSWDVIEKNVREVNGIGAWLRFVPGKLKSSDILVNQYNIQPYPIEDIEDIPEMIVDLLQDGIEGDMYAGPFYYNKKLDEMECCYYEISEDELEKDIEKFREGRNEYYTTFDVLDFTLPSR